MSFFGAVSNHRSLEDLTLFKCNVIPSYNVKLMRFLASFHVKEKPKACYLFPIIQKFASWIVCVTQTWRFD